MLALLAGLCSIESGWAQGANVLNVERPSPVSGTISRQQAIIALDSVFTWIERRHPAPYAYRPRVQVRRARRTLIRVMPDSVDRWWMADRLAYLVASLEIEPIWVFNLSRVSRPPSDTSTVFPEAGMSAFIEWIEEQAIVTHGERGLWPGDQILRINGVAIDSLIHHTAGAYTGTLSYRRHFAATQAIAELYRRGLLRAPIRVDLERWNGELVSLTLETNPAVNRAVRGDPLGSSLEHFGVAVVGRTLPNRAMVIQVGGLMIDPIGHKALLAKIAARLTANRAPALILDLRFEQYLPRWLVRSVLDALAPRGAIGRTRIPVCAVIGAQTTGGAARLVSALQKRRLARTLGEDAGSWRNMPDQDEGMAIPFLAAILVLPAQPLRPLPSVRRTLHPQIHVPMWRKDVAIGRDLAIEVASECGTLPAVP